LNDELMKKQTEVITHCKNDFYNLYLYLLSTDESQAVMVCTM